MALGGGIRTIITHRHFWKVVILFTLVVGGVRAWHYFKLRHDVQQEKTALQKNIDPHQTRRSYPQTPPAITPNAQ